LLASIDHVLENDPLWEEEAPPVSEALHSSAKARHNGRRGPKVHVKATRSSSPVIARMPDHGYATRVVTQKYHVARQAPKGVAAEVLFPGGRPGGDNQAASSTTGHVATRVFGLAETRGRGGRPT
jgi:hypothetical protein